MVVIGIIALLISILLPAILAARRQMYVIKCASNLRQVVAGCMLHAHDHGGYLPLAGSLQIDLAAWGEETISAGLNDRARKRYTYAKSPNAGIGTVIVPLPAAIGPYLGVKGLAFNDWSVLDQQLNDAQYWKMFMCPTGLERDRISADALNGQGTMMTVMVGANPSHYWSTNSDYAFNEGIFGYDYRAQYAHRRFNGKLTRVARPSEVALMCDALPASKVDPMFPSNFQYPWLTFAPAIDNTMQPTTLADVLANNAKVSPHRARFDAFRHRGKMNVVFADGHCEAVTINAAALQNVYVSVK